MTDTEIIPFNYVKGIKQKNHKVVHFYLDDYQFERVWNLPEKYMGMLSGFDYVFQPDFSLFTNTPLPIQLYNHFRKQWLGAYWELNGIKVIPTVGWSDERSFSFCFEGVPTESIVSVSSVGTQKSNQDKERFLLGYTEMLKRLNPHKILFYGNVPSGIDTSNIIHIEPFWKSIQERMKNCGR